LPVWSWRPCCALAGLLVGYRLSARRTKSFLGGALHIPSARLLDRRLVLGSLTFGVGWGIAGFCPGPALVGLGAFEPKAAIFVAAMLVGMGIHGLLEQRRK